MLVEVMVEALCGWFLSAALGVPVWTLCLLCRLSLLFGRLFGGGTALNVCLNRHLDVALCSPCWLRCWLR